MINNKCICEIGVPIAPTCPLHGLTMNLMKTGMEDKQPDQAKRNPVSYRYDILDPNFIHMMAEIAHLGAVTYGDYNWHKSRLAGDKSPINHIYKHLCQYRMGDNYDHLDGDRRYHLAAIAFNAMMEFYYATQPQKEE